MKIAILAWGSLIWDKRDLQITDKWNKGGVVLPIEFARISLDDRLTLVVTEQYGTDIETYWAISKFSELKDAINNLREREGTNKGNIGFVNLINCESKSHLSDKISYSKTTVFFHLYSSNIVKVFQFILISLKKQFFRVIY